MDKKFVEKALVELTETEEKRVQFLKEFRNWLAFHPFLKDIRKDDTYLLIYLRSKKYRFEDALKLIETVHLGIFKNKSVLDYGDETFEKMMRLYQSGCCVPMAQRNTEGQRLVLFRFGKYNPEIFSPYDFLRLAVYVFSILMEEEETQIAGISTVFDCADLTLKHLIGPVFLSRASSVAKCLAIIRYKTSYMINLPAFARIVADLGLKLLSDKVGMRFSTLNDPNKLKQLIDPSLLIKEYGGTQCVKEMMKKFSILEKKNRSKALAGWNYSKGFDKNVLNLAKAKKDINQNGSFQGLEID